MEEEKKEKKTKSKREVKSTVTKEDIVSKYKIEQQTGP